MFNITTVNVAYGDVSALQMNECMYNCYKCIFTLIMFTKQIYMSTECYNWTCRKLGNFQQLMSREPGSKYSYKLLPFLATNGDRHPLKVKIVYSIINVRKPFSCNMPQLCKGHRSPMANTDRYRSSTRKVCMAYHDCCEKALQISIRDSNYSRVRY